MPGIAYAPIIYRYNYFLILDVADICKCSQIFFGHLFKVCDHVHVYMLCVCVCVCVCVSSSDHSSAVLSPHHKATGNKGEIQVCSSAVVYSTRMSCNTVHSVV